MTVSTSQRVARNGALYFGSLAAPALAAVFLVPVTVHALGASRFGLLALAWALAEGAGMFDFGLSRTTVRFVADATARGAQRVREIILVSVLSQTAAGTITRQDPAPQSPLSPGQTITVWVSNGPPMANIPNIQGD